VKFAIAELTFSPPLTDEVWMQTTQSLVGCIAVRNIQWLYSLVSVQGDRAICLFEAHLAFTATSDSLAAVLMPVRRVP
jgi:hypothetical protein